MSTQVTTPRPALLNPDLVPGEPYITDEELRELWERVSAGVDPELPGQAVNALDAAAAKAGLAVPALRRTARALLFTLAVEGARARLDDAEQGSHRALYGEPNAIIR